MKHRWANAMQRPALALGLAIAPWLVQAQGADVAAQGWRQANETVGQFPRGHADVWRWEQSQPAVAATQDAAAQNIPITLTLNTPAEAVRQAWKMHPDLAAPLARLGADHVELIATGRWSELDPSLQRRIHKVDEVLEVAASTHKAWLDAVAERQTLKSLENAQTAAEAAAELGRRMVSVGTWNRMQQAQVALAESSARMDLKLARLAARQAEQALLKTMGLETLHQRVALPDRLPDAPTVPITEAQWQQRLLAIQGQLPMAEARRAAGSARQAYDVYLLALDLHRHHREDVLPKRELIGEETLLRYNGMLASVWDLLADVGVRSQAVAATIAAQRDALVAQIDLDWVLQGGQPTAWVALGGAGGGAPAAAAAPGH